MLRGCRALVQDTVGQKEKVEGKGATMSRKESEGKGKGEKT